MAPREYHGVEGSLVRSEAELVLHYREASRAEGKRQIVCGYCGKRHRPPLERQRDWFLNHQCVGTQEAAA